MKNKKINFFKKGFKESFDYVKSSKNYIYSVIGVFAIFVLLGFFIPVPESIHQIITNFINDLVSKTENLSYPGLIGFIFFNNIQSSFFGMIYGIVLGIFPVLASIANGYLLGFVASEVSKQEGIFILWRLLPHGIFELPALFISFGLGLKLGSFVFHEKKFETLKNYFLNSLKVFFFIVFPLILIAALIESTLIFFFG